MRRVGVLVVLDALHQRAGAVADADDGDANGSHGKLLFVRVVVLEMRSAWLAATVRGMRRRVRPRTTAPWCQRGPPDGFAMYDPDGP